MKRNIFSSVRKVTYVGTSIASIIASLTSFAIVLSRWNRNQIGDSHSPVVLSSRRQRYRKLTLGVNFIEIVCSKSLLFPIEELSTRQARMDVMQP